MNITQKSEETEQLITDRTRSDDTMLGDYRKDCHFAEALAQSLQHFATRKAVTYNVAHTILDVHVTCPIRLVCNGSQPIVGTRSSKDIVQDKGPVILTDVADVCRNVAQACLIPHSSITTNI